jgi:hypothetical protein
MYGGVCTDITPVRYGGVCIAITAVMYGGVCGAIIGVWNGGTARTCCLARDPVPRTVGLFQLPQTEDQVPRTAVTCCLARDRVTRTVGLVQLPLTEDQLPRTVRTCYWRRIQYHARLDLSNYHALRINYHPPLRRVAGEGSSTTNGRTCPITTHRWDLFCLAKDPVPRMVGFVQLPGTEDQLPRTARTCCWRGFQYHARSDFCNYNAPLGRAVGEGSSTTHVRTCPRTEDQYHSRLGLVLPGERSSTTPVGHVLASRGDLVPPSI